MKHISRKSEIPASSFQENLYFAQKLNPKNISSNTLFLNEIVGSCNEKWLSESLEMAIKCHELYRTYFKQIEDRVTQVIVPSSEIKFVLASTDLTHLSGDSQKNELFHLAHFISNPDEPPWVREGLAQLFEYMVVGKPNGANLISGLQVLQTPLMGVYRPQEINYAQYGHDFLFFYFILKNCGGEETISQIMSPSSIKGRAKIISVLASLESEKAFCRNFTELVEVFEVARAHNKIVLSKNVPFHLTGDMADELFRIWPISSLITAESSRVANYQSLEIYEPMILDENMKVIVSEPGFEVFWLGQESSFPILKTRLPPLSGRYRELIIRVR